MPPGAPERELPSWTVPADAAGTRLDKFLAAPERLGSRQRAIEALDRGKVFVNRREAGGGDAGSRLRTGDVVGVWMDRPGSARRPPPAEAGELPILYEDSAVVVVNKPAGLLAVPLQQRSDAPSAQAYVERHLRPGTRRRPLVVHRIDRDTSGIVVFAKSARAQEQLKDQFERREPERVYWAVVHGRPEPPAGDWCDRLTWDADRLLQTRAHPRDPKGKEAVSHYRVLETFSGAALVEIRLETGKRNQIRIQAALRGHTLFGERLYVSRGHGPVSAPFGRQALHAYRLAFRHPVDGRQLAFEAPLPDDLLALLVQLRGESS